MRYTSIKMPTMPVYAVFVLILVACGGGGGGGGNVAGGGIGGTGITTSGAITGFGSVFVNENKFEVIPGGTSILENDEDAAEADLRVGMVVTVRGTPNADGNFDADSIEYDPELEGPVSSVGEPDPDGLERVIVVLGTNVVLSANDTVFDDSPGSTIGFDTIISGMFVEVSGFYDQNGAIRASYIERQDSTVYQPGVTAIEAKGTISNSDGNGFDLVLPGGSVLTVVNVAGAVLDDIAELQDGLFVEVEGTLNVAGDTLDVGAGRIEAEGFEAGDEDNDIEIEGIVSEFTGNLASFMVAGQEVNAATANFEPVSLLLADGTEVEVEGRFVSGVLVAESVKASGGSIEIEATIAVNGVDVDAGTIRLGPMGSNSAYLDVHVDSGTRLEDELEQILTWPFSLDDLMDGDFVEVEAYSDNGTLVATQVRRNEAGNIILQGPVDTATSDPLVSVLGVVFDTTGLGDTDFEDEFDENIGRAAFFERAEQGGELVKIQDDNDPPGTVADGFADSVEFED